MFNQFEPNVKATIRFLKLLNVKVTNITVNETLQNHPDWPSLLCISDSLNKWNVPNGAGKIDVDKIDELPTPFIAHTINREYPLVIVTNVSAAEIKGISKGHNKETTVKRDEFLKNWDGVYLFAEPHSESGEKEYETNKKKEFINSLVPSATVALIFIIATYAMYKNITNISPNQKGFASNIFFQYFISLAGVFVTSLLLWYEIDKNNPLLQKVCTGIAKGNCNAILTGKHAKVFNWLSWSEVGFFYFSGSLMLMFGISKLPDSMFVLAWLNVLALPYTVFSIYYQWKVAKQWCILCLSVQALLVLGCMNVIIDNSLFPLPQFSPLLVAKYLFPFVLPTLIWFVIKPYILRLQEAKNTKREYLRIKFNAEIFETLLKKQKPISISVDGLGIDIGNPAATNTIIKVCNPYCGPCSKAHPKIEKLLESISNLKIKIIFATPNSEEYISIKPIRHLLALAENATNQLLIKEALDSWYIPEKKDYEKFASKYPLNGQLKLQSSKIDAMNNWCDATGIVFTPTIFINGHQLPDAYDIEDLQYFLLE